MSNDRMWLLNEKLGLAARLGKSNGCAWTASSEVEGQLDALFEATCNSGLDESSLRIVTEGDFIYGDVCQYTGLRKMHSYEKNPLLDKLDSAQAEIDRLKEQNSRMFKEIDFLKISLMLKDKHIEKLKSK